MSHQGDWRALQIPHIYAKELLSSETENGREWPGGHLAWMGVNKREMAISQFKHLQHTGPWLTNPLISAEQAETRKLVQIVEDRELR